MGGKYLFIIIFSFKRLRADLYGVIRFNTKSLMYDDHEIKFYFD